MAKHWVTILDIQRIHCGGLFAAAQPQTLMEQPVHDCLLNKLARTAHVWITYSPTANQSIPRSIVRR
jgi:hypothetical protein